MNRNKTVSFNQIQQDLVAVLVLWVQPKFIGGSPDDEKPKHRMTKEKSCII